MTDALVARDPALTRRAGVTLAAVLLVDLTAVLLLGFLLRPWLAPIGRAFAGGATGTDGTAGGSTLVVPPAFGWLAFVVPALALFVFVQLRYTRRELLAEADAEPATREKYPDLHGRLTRLAQQAQMAVPGLAIAPSPVPNCLSIGGSSPTVVVSEGLLDALAGDELDAALAHELAHLQNRDAAVMTLASFLPALATGEYSLLGALSPRGWSNTATLAVVAALAGVVGLAGVSATGDVSPLVALAALAVGSLLFGGVVLGVVAAPVVVLSRRLSRTREFAADRAGSLITGDPGALAGALRTLDGYDAPTTDARTAVAAFCLMPYGLDPADDGEDDAGDGGTDGTPAVDPFAVQTKSHPTVEQRVERLRGVAEELERA